MKTNTKLRWLGIWIYIVAIVGSGCEIFHHIVFGSKHLLADYVVAKVCLILFFIAELIRHIFQLNEDDKG